MRKNTDLLEVTTSHIFCYHGALKLFAALMEKVMKIIRDRKEEYD
jgi:hypothetical protein